MQSLLLTSSIELTEHKHPHICISLMINSLSCQLYLRRPLTEQQVKLLYHKFGNRAASDSENPKAAWTLFSMRTCAFQDVSYWCPKSRITQMPLNLIPTTRYPQLRELLSSGILMCHSLMCSVSPRSSKSHLCIKENVPYSLRNTPPPSTSDCFLPIGLHRLDSHSLLNKALPYLWAFIVPWLS